jgi:CRP/FNR family cyclic AMP-dependent transcriptional regulator
MDQTDPVELLRSVDLFDSLTDRQLKALAARTRVTDHAAGHEIATEGQEGVGFHLILSGHASVLVGGTETRKLGPGDYFGEVALIDGQLRSATVRTDEPVKTLALTSWEFRPLLDEDPALTKSLLLKLVGRLRDAEARHSGH